MEAFEMKPIPGYSGYQATTDGRIWSDKRQRFLTSHSNEAGYTIVSLSVDGKAKKSSVHRLVALTFLPNPDPSLYTDIDHIDEDPANNRLENLAWITHQENTAKAQAKKVGVPKYRFAVGAYNIKTGKLEFVEKTAAAIARKIKSNTTCVHHCLKGHGNRRTTHGYVVTYMLPVEMLLAI